MVPAIDGAGGRWLDATRAPSLQRVANRPIICRVLDSLAAAGVEEVAVLSPPGITEEIAGCVAAEGPMSCEVQHLSHDCLTEPQAALDALARFAEDAPTIIHRGDGLLGQPLGPFLELLDGEESEMVLLIARGARNPERIGPAAQRLLRVTEFDPDNGALGIAGVCALGPGRLRDAGHAPEFGALVEAQIEHGERVQVRVVHDEWRAFTGDARDLLDINRAVLDALDTRTPPPGEDNRFEGRVQIDPSATVTASVICGPVIVGAGAYIANSYIGPHTAIGDRVHIDGAEIERSIVLSGASILHVGGRLVASVVGRDARIFRDFSMPRAMRLQVGDGDEVALC